MKINEFTNSNHVDEISAADAGAVAGKATRAVGTGAKKAASAVGSGIKNFAKGFASGVKGQSTPTTKANPTLDPIKVSIAKLNPKQQAALRKQLAKKAGVA